MKNKLTLAESIFSASVATAIAIAICISMWMYAISIASYAHDTYVHTSDECCQIIYDDEYSGHIVISMLLIFLSFPVSADIAIELYQNRFKIMRQIINKMNIYPSMMFIDIIKFICSLRL